jgi:hypothetical protein
MAIEHPPPTNATVKRLYATAYACAYPGCDDPLYREDELAGIWTLNSRICHIHARREGGPRWKADQPSEDNRAEHNLLLMCLEHASVIDDDDALETFTGPLLRQWKATQLSEYRQRMGGWPLTTAMAERAIVASFADGGIIINQSTVDLRGEGGRAPGAGGGGGGALGHGARAGKGGDGGNLSHEGPNPLPPDVLKEMLAAAMSDPKASPGAGGGGATVVGDEGVAGDGGGGGDIATGSLELEPGDTLEVEIGEGGEPASLPGEHARDGGDSVILHRSADGSLRQIIRVKSGAGASAGRLADGVAQITQDDLAGGFQISTLMIANAIEAQNGLLYILGGGWSHFTAPTLPFEPIFPVLCTAAWGRLDRSAVRGLNLCLVGPDGTETSRVALELPIEALNETNYSWLTRIGARLTDEGQWTISVQSGDFLLSQIELRVALAV